MNRFRIKHGIHHVICEHEKTAEKVAIALSIEDDGKMVLVETNEDSERLGFGSGVYRPWSEVTGGHATEVTSVVRYLQMGRLGDAFVGKCEP